MTLSTILPVILAIVLGPFIGALIAGLDRKITARVQGRRGPPIIQPCYDVLKLLRKDALAVNRIQLVYVWLHLAFMIMAVVFLALGQDMLMALFAYTFSGIALILGGMSVRSPYSRIGSYRKIMQMFAYEPILILMIVGVYLTTGSFRADSVVQQPLLVKLPLVFLTFLMAAAIKMEKSPFDIVTSHHAHQEIVKGITIEYAGPYLALIEITHFYEIFIVFAVVAAFWATSPGVGVAIAAAGFLALIVLDNVFARLTPMWMLRYMWAVPLPLALLNIFWLYYA